MDKLASSETSPRDWSDSQVSEWMRKKREDSIKMIDDDPVDMTHMNLIQISFAERYRKLNRKDIESLRNVLMNKSLLDLGAGHKAGGIAKFYAEKCGIKRYTGVDLEYFYEPHPISVPVNLIRDEAYGYLTKTDSNSTNVVSSGFLCSEITGIGQNPESAEYLGRIFKEIKRVLPTNGVFVADHFDLDEHALKAGLRLENTLSEGEIKIFRKE